MEFCLQCWAAQRGGQAVDPESTGPRGAAHALRGRAAGAESGTTGGGSGGSASLPHGSVEGTGAALAVADGRRGRGPSIGRGSGRGRRAARGAGRGVAVGRRRRR
eukprot:3448471-Pleurochrysis_carterae.AAC.2